MERDIQEARKKVSPYSYKIQHEKELVVSPRLAGYFSRAFYHTGDMEKYEYYSQKAKE